MDLTDTSMTFAATLLVEGFRLLLSRAMTGEKKRNPLDELVIAFFDISRAHFHSPVRREVAIRMLGDPSCPSGIAMLNRAMYGTKDAAQCFDLYCEPTMEKIGLQHWSVQPVSVQTSCQRHQCTQTRRRFCQLGLKWLNARNS